MTPVIRGSSLYVIVEGPTWDQALTNSEDLGGTLAVIKDEQENLFITNSFKTNSDLFVSSNYSDDYVAWIGITYDFDANTYINTLGDEQLYFNWNPTFQNPIDSSYGDINTTIILQSTSQYVSSEGVWDDSWENQAVPYYRNGIAEIPLNLSITTPSTPTEGAGVFSTSINLSAGTEASGNLAEGAEVFWSVSGITEDDLESGAPAGSGFITDGKLSIEHSLVNDDDSGETFNVSVFSDAEMTQQIGETQSFEVLEGEADPITGDMGLRRKVKLKNRGKVKFRLYGSEEIDVNAIDFDSILFGGDPEALMADAPAADDYFQGAKRKRGKKAGSYRAKIIDINDDGFDDIKIKVLRKDIAGVTEKRDTEIYAYSQMGEESFLWSNTDTLFF